MDDQSKLMEDTYKMGRRMGFFLAIKLLKGEQASLYAFSKLETTQCSKNDAHLTRWDWANWLEFEGEKHDIS